jgi:transposase
VAVARGDVTTPFNIFRHQQQKRDIRRGLIIRLSALPAGRRRTGATLVAPIGFRLMRIYQRASGTKPTVTVNKPRKFTLRLVP